MPLDHAQGAVVELPLDAIRVEGRFRRELGDIAARRQHRRVGLLRPVVVTPDYRLIAGARRLHAMRKLGRTHVPVRVVPLAEGRVRNVQFVNPIYIGGELVRIEMRVLG